MSAPARKPVTLAQFLDWEETQPLRHEFDGFRPIAMTGGIANHAAVQRNLAISVGGRLRGQPCRFVGSDLKIEVAGWIRYPDSFVFCSPLPGSAKLVRDPVVIFEVLSESTTRTDLITKKSRICRNALGSPLCDSGARQAGRCDVCASRQ